MRVTNRPTNHGSFDVPPEYSQLPPKWQELMANAPYEDEKSMPLFRKWRDGVEQIAYQGQSMGNDPQYSFLAIERVVKAGSRRKNWTIVDRGGAQGESVYPRNALGRRRFESVVDALLMYDALISLRGGYAHED